MIFATSTPICISEGKAAPVPSKNKVPVKAAPEELERVATRSHSSLEGV